ncbi:MAG TPA: hypothetical protein VFY49_12905 [Myxococcota bacterium]|nr:hypothetical protein [Myxococcota bacterium]
MDTTHPIVLAHGIARFDVLLRRLDPDAAGPIADGTHYFRRIRSTLEAVDGYHFQVHQPIVTWAAGVEVRARDLWNYVRTLEGPVHIIAHSMGGLDARHMLYGFRAAGAVERVASITTIGTPHFGTSFADWGLELGDELLRVLDAIGIDGVDGFRDLSTAACQEFDARVRSFEESCGVLFQTYAGAQPFLRTFAPLKFAWLVIHERDRAHDGGANDGLVPLYSARWRPSCYQGRLDADHLNQIGWCDPDELSRPFIPSPERDGAQRRALEEQIRDVYVAIAKRLAARFPASRSQRGGGATC